ncbi:glycosyltransferase [Erythrobacteraceae bacterium E2-1 Yellow Sea]|nr:glycosyltransferase [Erythrobacteraceae bacterium E2-1 Yellow Sea]
MSRQSTAKPRLLHCFARNDGVSAARANVLIEAFGGALDHSIVVADALPAGAVPAISCRSNVHYPANFPEFSGKPTPGKLARLAQAMGDFDLVLTYDWGALNVAMAHTAFAQKSNLPPLIHHEIGFGENDRSELGIMRNWYRRIALGRTFGLVVENEQLEGIALADWQQPIGRVRRIPVGVNTADFALRPADDALRGIIKRDGELWVGCVCDLSADTGMNEIIASFAPLKPQWQLVIWGEGQAKEAIRAEAARLEISHRVHLPGVVQDLPTIMGLLDIFVQIPGYAASPVQLAQAMAAGLPVWAARAGDAEEMLSPENQHVLYPALDKGSAADMLDTLAEDAQLRADIGVANRRAARARFDTGAMVEAYRRLYASALQREIG